MNDQLNKSITLEDYKQGIIDDFSKDYSKPLMSLNQSSRSQADLLPKIKSHNFMSKQNALPMRSNQTQQ